MSTKVKVSKKVAMAIEYLMEIDYYKGDKGKLLSAHASGIDSWRIDTLSKGLNGLSVMELAEILVNGYEVEMTPEEIIKEKYEELFDYEPIDRACKDSFRFVLDTLNIKITGVNE